MRALVLMSALVVLTSACVSVRENQDLLVPADGVGLVHARLDRGDLRLVAREGGTAFDGIVTPWATGSRRDAVERRQDAVDWSAVVERNTFFIESRAREGRSGVDFDLDSPLFMDTDLVLDQGTATVDGLDGFHVVTATNVRGTFIGDIDLFGRSGVDVAFIPYLETDAVIESEGPITLALPFGLEYDLTIRADGQDELLITDLGWDDARLAEGFFSGLRGRGLVEIDVFAGGRVTIVELR